MTNSSCQPWSQGRWCIAAGLLFGLHVAVIHYFARPESGPGGLELPTSSFSFLPPGTTDLKEQWIANPAAFALPDPAGFSGSAAKWLPRTALPAPSRESRPEYMLSGPDTVLGPLPEVRPPAGKLYARGGSSLLPVELPPVVNARTRLSFSRPLAARAPEAQGNLPVWQGDGLPAPTWVEAAINPLGEVEIVRVLESSKSRQMDAQALALVGTMRFKALPGAELDSAHDASKFAWSAVTVLWAPAPLENR